ncbi:hypothetical protein V7S43_000159 [Phytophthora oleae]|uniref:Uncharacterized protein n=1 Tax=Phytophthora oleae TaxID=2107226 RepID=A0ABD3G8S6_9STRA
MLTVAAKNLYEQDERLEQRLVDQRREIENLEQRVAEQGGELEDLKQRLARLEALLQN